jgi:toxin ParE1/3/4
MEQISEYLAKRSLSGAVAVLEMLLQKFEFLGQHPIAGDVRPELGSRVRAYPAGSFVIYFKAFESGAEIARIFHGARDIHSLEQE